MPIDELTFLQKITSRDSIDRVKRIAHAALILITYVILFLDFLQKNPIPFSELIK